MRKLIYFGILLFILLIQSTLLIQYQPFGVIPDLLLILVVSGALLRGSKFGVQLGFTAGILLDLILGSFGTNIIIKVFVGYLVGTLEGKVFKQQILIPILVVFLITFVHEFIFLFLSEQLIFSIPFVWALKAKIFPLALVNSLFTILIYPGIYLLERKFNNY
ncbi:rod shape-determining protein MreD [Anoxybacter fermentans]|uniref:Rod shape-determining protein MreD n=1 Tax=Anoxybacter fermentans TaxID=1323375 RepID=A0A3S9SY54_9FIRM|nr:rod shape-determining protein MreD [Anoxybacter fermentans]AZR73286.1 rod shape-determining protein MreD [Anoxybacter fermentans]